MWISRPVHRIVTQIRGRRIPTHPWVAVYASPTVLSRVEEQPPTSYPSYHPSNGAGSAKLKVGAAIWRRINGGTEHIFGGAPPLFWL